MYRFVELYEAWNRCGDNERALSRAPSFGIGLQDEWASRCVLGILPMKKGSFALEALACPLPPDDTQLVIMDPDADKLTAMAVLELRLEGEEFDVEKVRRIAALDPDAYTRANQLTRHIIHTGVLRCVNHLSGWLTGEVELPPSKTHFEPYTKAVEGAAAAAFAGVEYDFRRDGRGVSIWFENPSEDVGEFDVSDTWAEFSFEELKWNITSGRGREEYTDDMFPAPGIPAPHSVIGRLWDFLVEDEFCSGAFPASVTRDCLDWLLPVNRQGYADARDPSVQASILEALNVYR